MRDIYEVECAIDTPRRRVWQALTESNELETWFSEHADIDIAAGRYDFWGCHTPGVPTRDGGRHQLLDCEPSRLLRFLWPRLGVDTIVTIMIDRNTRVRVLHENVAARVSLCGHLPSHLWSFALGHLRAYLQTGRPGPRFDWSWQHLGGFTAHADIDASPQEVWSELVDKGWLAAKSPRRRPARNVHEDFGFDVGVIVGIKVLDLDPPHRLSLSWIGDQPTVLTYVVQAADGGSHVTISHTGFDACTDVQGIAEGFFSGVMEIAWTLESGGVWRPGGPGTVRVLQDGQHDRRLAIERS